jgi:UDP-sulfoquinovose synthase
MSHILILGGDGYLGWPASMFFSKLGHEVTVVDNYFRRKICDDLDVGMLYSIPLLDERAQIWHEHTGKEIKVIIGDLSDPELMRSLFTGNFSYEWAINSNFTGIPDTVIHFAEQPSAPYSLMNYQTANFTITNNLLITNNLMFAVKDLAPNTHIIKLGTMGEYGTPNIDIEEGWLDIKHNNRSDLFLFPRQASSLYHTTKIMDTDLLWFGVRTWGLRVTDLMQGPVYGIESYESSIDHRLKTLFNYDEIFGTVINRFIVQAIIEFPLTVYGKGSQIRGYINIKDTLECLKISAFNPPEKGKLSIYNQITETFTVNDLAKMVQNVGLSLGYDVQVKNIKNPRIEKEKHYYNPKYQGLISLGLKPHYLNDKLVKEMFKIIAEHKSNIRKSVIFNGLKW